KSRAFRGLYGTNVRANRLAVLALISGASTSRPHSLAIPDRAGYPSRFCDLSVIGGHSITNLKLSARIIAIMQGLNRSVVCALLMIPSWALAQETQPAPATPPAQTDQSKSPEQKGPPPQTTLPRSPICPMHRHQ